MNRTIFIIFLFLLSFVGFADNLKKCESFIEKEDYVNASIALTKYFKEDITHKNISVFYLGVITYKLQFIKRSEEAFLKFLAIDTERSAYYDSSLYYLSSLALTTNDRSIANKVCQHLGPGESTVACSNCDGQGYKETDCPICHGEGKQTCQACNGTGVHVEYGSFGSVYKTCLVCNGSGTSTCSHCEGEGVSDHICHVCTGTGVQQEERDCTLIAKKIRQIQNGLENRN